MVAVVNEKYFDIETVKYGEDWITSYTVPYNVGKEKKPKTIASVRFSGGPENFNEENTRIDFHGKPWEPITMNQSASNPYSVPVFIVAIPFVGIIEPVQKSYDFRIHSVTMAQPDENKRGRIVYLVISFNSTLFDPDNKNHKSILKFAFSNYFKKYENLPDGTSEATSMKRTVSIILTDTEYNVVEEEEDASDVDVSQFRGQKPFFLFTAKPANRDNGNGNKRPFNKKPNNFQDRNQTNLPSAAPELPAVNPEKEKREYKKNDSYKKKNYQQNNGLKKPAFKGTKQDRQKRGFEKNLQDYQEEESNQPATKQENTPDKNKSRKSPEIGTPVVPKNFDLEKMIAAYQKESKEKQKQVNRDRRNNRKRK